MDTSMNEITKKLLELVSNFSGSFEGAFNIRENGQCVGRQSTEHIDIQSKKDKPGLDITVMPGTKGEKVYIPACVTEGGIDDKVYNDFYIGEDSDIEIISGCGVQTDNHSEARHSGIHRFFIGENAHVHYIEKHVGTGVGNGDKIIDPEAEIYLEKNAYMEMDSTQISGVNHTIRKTTATADEGAKLVVHERLFTEADQRVETYFKVDLNGEGSAADIVSRSVARDQSYQTYESLITGNAPCSGHSECDAIIDGDALVDASPRLFAHHEDASLIHEAAIGKIAGEQILKFRTLGLTEEEAENKIIEGFLA